MPNAQIGFGGEIFLGGFLAFEISDFAFIEEKIGKGHALCLVAGGAMTQIKDDVLGALFL